MIDEQENPWQRQENEPTNWYERFLVYLQMGPSRTLLGAVHLAEKDQNRPKKISVPGIWRDTFRQWQWKSRALAFDDYRRKQIFTFGNAYDVNRVEKLNNYSQRLETELDKMLEALAEKKIEKPWFNQFLYEKYLQTLEALAAETGGRVKVSKTDVTSVGEKIDNSQYIFYMPKVDEEGEEPKNDDNA